MKYLFSLACLATSILAAPAPPKGTFEWTPTLAGYMDVVFQYIQQAKAGGASPTCDLSKAAMPVAPTPLPTPSGLTLEHVALGRGVQVSLLLDPTRGSFTDASNRIIPVPTPQQRRPRSGQLHVSTTHHVWHLTGLIFYQSCPTWLCNIPCHLIPMPHLNHQTSLCRLTTSSQTIPRRSSRSTLLRLPNSELFSPRRTTLRMLQRMRSLEPTAKGMVQ